MGSRVARKQVTCIPRTSPHHIAMFTSTTFFIFDLEQSFVYEYNVIAIPPKQKSRPQAPKCLLSSHLRSRESFEDFLAFAFAVKPLMLSVRAGSIR